MNIIKLQSMEEVKQFFQAQKKARAKAERVADELTAQVSNFIRETVKIADTYGIPRERVLKDMVSVVFDTVMEFDWEKYDPETNLFKEGTDDETV